MRLVADESIRGAIVGLLRSRGHEVVAIREIAPGSSDDEVLQLAHRLGAVLITADKDFGELIYRRGSASSGAILVRLASLPASIRAEMIIQLLDERADSLHQYLAVLAPGSVRLRKLPPSKKPNGG